MNKDMYVVTEESTIVIMNDLPDVPRPTAMLDFKPAPEAPWNRQSLRVPREDETLYTQATGQPRAEVVPTSETSFKLIIVDASVTFHRNDDGDVDALTLHQGGEHRATRLEDEQADTAEIDLEDYVGRFFSAEIETFYDAEIEDERLVLKQRRMDDRKLVHGSQDSFSGGGLQIEFERDRNGHVIGMYVSNLRTRDVRFARVD